MNKTVQTAIRFEYTVLRAPLTLLDRQVVSRLDEHSLIRSTFERGLGTLDATAARFLDTPPAPAPPTALPAEEVEEVQHLAGEFIAEQEQRNLAGELAEDEELRHMQAELRAKHQVEEEHERGD